MFTNTKYKVQVLDPDKKIETISEIRNYLCERIIGQRDAIDAVCEILEASALPRQANRPLGSVIMLGPTGTGKTRLAECTAEALKTKLLKVNCAEFQESHRISSLIGAPSSYVGYGDPPILNKEALAESHVLLFDEIEKAHHSLPRLLLSVLDRAELRIGKGEIVRFDKYLIFFTSNIGSRELADLAAGSGFDYAGRSHASAVKITESALADHFPPEFLNRITKVVQFSTLTREDILAVLGITLANVQARVLLSERPFVLVCDKAAKEALVAEGYSAKFGARELERIVEKRIAVPLASLLATKQVEAGDLVSITHRRERYRYAREVGKAMAETVAAVEKIRPKLEPKKELRKSDGEPDFWPYGI